VNIREKRLAPAYSFDKWLEKKQDELRNVVEQNVINLNIEVESTKEEKKEPYRFIFNGTNQRSIEVKTTKKVIGDEKIPESKIIKENGTYLVVKETSDSEKAKELLKNDPVIKLP
jgi:hypothetical protein